jgi:Flp pilus assembly protein TadB
MGIGVGIFMIAVGAILSFAVADRISGVDLTVVGYILMACGALGLVLVLFLHSQRRTTAGGTETTIEERRIRE